MTIENNSMETAWWLDCSIDCGCALCQRAVASEDRLELNTAETSSPTSAGARRLMFRSDSGLPLASRGASTSAKAMPRMGEAAVVAGWAISTETVRRRGLVALIKRICNHLNVRKANAGHLLSAAETLRRRLAMHRREAGR